MIILIKRNPNKVLIFMISETTSIYSEITHLYIILFSGQFRVQPYSRSAQSLKNNGVQNMLSMKILLLLQCPVPIFQNSFYDVPLAPNILKMAPRIQIPFRPTNECEIFFSGLFSHKKKKIIRDKVCPKNEVRVVFAM